MRLDLTRLLCRHEVRKVTGPPKLQLRLDAANTAREIERDLVPEWRLKYLDYKVRLLGVLSLRWGPLTVGPGWQEETQGHRPRFAQRQPDTAAAPTWHESTAQFLGCRPEVLVPEP